MNGKRYYHSRQQVDAIADELELDEIIIAGAEALYDEADEKWRVLHAAANLLERRNMDYEASGIRRHIKLHRDECLASGVCPYCGGDVEVRREVERHPAPFGMGTAKEERQVYWCDNCEEV